MAEDTMPFKIYQNGINNLLRWILVCATLLCVAAAATAEVYVVGRLSDNVVVFDDTGAFVQAVSLPTGFSSDARDIAQAPNRDIFVLRGEGAVHRYDLGLNFIATWNSFNIAWVGMNSVKINTIRSGSFSSAWS